MFHLLIGVSTAKWYDLYQSAIFELDYSKLPMRIYDARQVEAVWQDHTRCTPTCLSATRIQTSGFSGSGRRDRTHSVGFRLKPGGIQTAPLIGEISRLHSSTTHQFLSASIRSVSHTKRGNRFEKSFGSSAKPKPRRELNVPTETD